ncbi:MAG: penicillin-binding protein [Firmicutes bacterium]|nr:penicillin-binding protein [Bacillota bacterium]
MFQAYHGVTGAQHQAKFNELSTKGFRMISLSVYGDPSDARYAAVWVERSGPAWVAVHGVDSAGYQSFFNSQTANGYVPVLISATGSASRAIFAAVFEKGVTGAWFARHGMTSGPEANAGTFQNQNKIARDQKMVLRSVAIYGTASDRRYAAVWHANPAFVKWHVHPSDTGASYQAVFNAEIQLPGYRLAGYRPAYVALAGDQIYCSVFKDDVVGDWVARHGMTAAEYQAEFDKQNAAGLYPICVQGGGSGSGTRYAAIFAKRDIPLSREWTATGSAIPALAALDQKVQTFMQANGVRAAQLAIAKNGVTKFSRAYTWAEAGYHITQPSDRFLLASCSKMFLEAAVQALYDAHKLTPDTKVYPLLGFSHPADPRSDTITIQQLLNHTGGYDDTATGSRFDPTYNMRKIAVDLNLGHPVTKLDVARYMYQRMLDFSPGTNNKYSNFGYLLAGAVVEKVSGMGFFDYVKKTLLQPANISEVSIIPTRAADRTNDEVIVEDEGLGLSPLDLASQLLVPAVYGGDGEINEVGDPNDGLGASAQALTQFIHLHAVWGNGARMAGAARSGSTPGASSLAVSRGDGVDWAYVINTRDWPAATTPTLDDLEKKLITPLLDSTPIS